MTFKKYIDWKLLFKQLGILFSSIIDICVFIWMLDEGDKHPYIVIGITVSLLITFIILGHISDQQDLELKIAMEKGREIVKNYDALKSDNVILFPTKNDN